MRILNPPPEDRGLTERSTFCLFIIPSLSFFIGPPPPALCRGSRSGFRLGDLQPVRLHDIRVDRSTLQRSLSSSKIDEGISHFCFGKDRIGFCLSRRSRADRRFPLLPSLSHQHIENRSTSVYRQFPTVLSVSDGGVHSRSLVGLRGSSLRHRLRSPRPPTFSDVQGVACRIGHRGIHRRSWRHPQRIILATPLNRTAPNLLPRRVRSACRAQR